MTQADIDALKGDASDLTSQKKELEAKLSSLSDDKAQVLKKKEVLDQQIAVQVKGISNVESQISTYADLITQTQAELVDAQEREAAQYDLFCRRVRAMEEDGTVSYWSVLFKSDSFTDLLDRLDAVNEIMDADQAVIDQLKALQDEISEKEASLQTSKSEAEAAKADLVSKKSALEQQRKQANQMIAQLAANEEETEAAIDGMEEEEERIRNEIQELSRKLAAQQAANGQSSHSNPGGYIWPVDSRYITSTVGGRASRRSWLHQSQGHRYRPGGIYQPHLCVQGRNGHCLSILQILWQLCCHLPRQWKHNPLWAYVQPEGRGGAVCQSGRCDRNYRLHRQLHRAPSAL